MTTPDGTSSRLDDVRLWRAVLAAGAAATGVFAVVPSGSVHAAVAWSVPFVLATVLLTARVRVSRGPARGPLQLLLTGQVLYALASVVWYVGPVHLGAVLPFPSPLDAAFFAAYASFAAFLLVVLRRRPHDSGMGSRLAMADAAILTLAVTAVLWVAVIEPNLSNGTPALPTLVAVLYPAVQLVIFGLATHLALSVGVGGKEVSALLFLWIGGELFGDVFYGVQSVSGTFDYGGPLVPVWMLAYTGLAAFAAHPGVVGFLEPHARPDCASARVRRLVTDRVRSGVRLGLLLLAAVVPLALAAVTAGQDVTLMAIAAATFALTLYRASLLAGDLVEQRRLGAELDEALARLRGQHRELARLAVVVDSTTDVVVTCSPDGEVLTWNRGAELLYGYSPAEAVGQDFRRFLSEQDRQSFHLSAAVLAQHGHHKLDAVMVRKDGSTVQVETTLSVVSDDAGQTLIGISRDVTERNRLQQELAAHVRQLDEAQWLAGVGSFSRDLRTGRDVWSSEYCRILGLDEGVEASYALYLERLHPDDRCSVQERMRLHRPGEPLEYEARIVRPDGQLRWIAVRGELHAGPDGVSVAKTGTAQDITDRKLAEAELERLALTDALTGLANRDCFTRRLQSALDGADGRSVGLLLLDLDGFKDVNDGIGHHAGDLVLQEVARRVAGALRGDDHVARLGGDEFAIVLPDVAGVDDAIAAATRVRSCLEPAFDLDGITVHVGGSIGIAVSDGRMDTGALLKQADVAMYRAKTLSWGWAVFEPDQDDVAAGRLQMVTDLRAAIEQGDLEVVYQPVLDARTRRVSSFEALARWNHPDKGVIPPDQFIPLAEQADLIVALTRLVLGKAAGACARWRRAGHDVRVAVNLSVQVMQNGDARALVADALAGAGLAPEHLVLEVTESSLAIDADRVRPTLAALHELGVTLSIDDFGTGYSAMSYLKELPVEELKIDRSFVRDITSDTRDLAIVRSLIRLAHSLSLRVVAEGVESMPALEVLTALGCDFAQGYGIARPMPESDTAGWLVRYPAPTAASVADGPPTDLLVVDDSPVVRARLTHLADQAGWHVRDVASAEEAIAEVERSMPDVIVLDHHMAGMSGMDAVPQLRDRGFDGPILLFTRFLSDAIPSQRMPLDVWPVSKKNPDAVLDLLAGYRASGRPARR